MAADLSPQLRRSLDLAGVVKSRTLPLGCLGYGAADAPAKAATFLHTRQLEGGAAFGQARWRLRGLCTDQSTEKAIRDLPNLTDHDAVRQAIMDISSGHATMPENLAAFTWPLMLWVPDCLHVVFDAVENSIQGLRASGVECDGSLRFDRPAHQCL